MEVSVPQKVQVFSLGVPAAGIPKERRRYRVKWRVEGRDKTRSIKTKALAEQLRSQLQLAADAGARFDHDSGMPESWGQVGDHVVELVTAVCRAEVATLVRSFTTECC